MKHLLVYRFIYISIVKSIIIATKKGCIRIVRKGSLSNVKPSTKTKTIIALGTYVGIKELLKNVSFTKKSL